MISQSDWEKICLEVNASQKPTILWLTLDEYMDFLLVNRIRSFEDSYESNLSLNVGYIFGYLRINVGVPLDGIGNGCINVNLQYLLDLKNKV